MIADHARSAAFSIADGIQPGNTDRNYVLRRILRRAVKYGRTLGFHEPFFYKLVDVLADTMGEAFPELRKHQERVRAVMLLRNLPARREELLAPFPEGDHAAIEKLAGTAGFDRPTQTM